KFALLALSALGGLHCGEPGTSGGGLLVTTAPLAMIARPLLGPDVDIHVLVPPGQSPHTYALLPSDARYAESAAALPFVHPELDGGAQRLPVRNAVALADLLPGNALRADPEHGRNPHVWMDPVLVRDLIGPLADRLADAFPDRAATIQQNASAFSAELE